MECLEAAVQARLPAAQVRVVHDVVVGEGRRVEQLQGSGRGDDGVEPVVDRGLIGRVERVGSHRDRRPAPVAESGAEPLAAGEELACRGRQLGELGGDAPKRRVLLVEEADETIVDEID